MRLRRELKGACIGEERCSEIGLIAEMRELELPILEICSGCKFRDTKPGSEPQHLTRAISAALELDELHRAGATFAFPDVLTPYEWTLRRAITTAREADEADVIEERQQKAAEDQDRARLEAMRRRRR